MSDVTSQAAPVTTAGAAAPPVAAVVETRRTIGTTTIVEVQCPFARHRHTVGLTDRTAVLWCTYGAGFYTVTLEEATP